jgi:hypothetical protein
MTTSITTSLTNARARASKKVVPAASPVVSERAGILFKCIAIGGEVTNIQNMLFMKKGDVYMEYCNALSKTSTGRASGKVDYPHLRAAIELDLLVAPTQVIDKIVILKGVKKAKKVTVYPWGEMSIKMKAHSLAVSMLKTYQRRALKFGKETKLTGITVFNKYSNYGKPEAAVENKTIDITFKSVTKSFDEKRALDFLNSFLAPAPAAKLVKKAA